MRRLLWRLVSPSAAFAIAVQQALFSKRMCALLRELPALAGLGEAELVALVTSAEEVKMQRYMRLYREGAASRCLYVLLDGTLEHTASAGGVPQGQRVQSVELAKGGWRRLQVHGVVVGVEALQDGPRLTNATAVSECRLLQFPVLGLSQREVVREFVRCELPLVPIFCDLPAEKLAQIVPLVGVIEHAEGENVLEYGVVPAHFVVLAQGSVSIVLGNGMCVASLQAQSDDQSQRYPIFGEMGLLANKPAMAFVRATSAVKCLTVSRQNFARFLDLVPDFEERIKAIARARAKENELKLKLKKDAEELAGLMAVAKAEEVLALPEMHMRKLRDTGDYTPSFAGVATAVLETTRLNRRRGSAECPSTSDAIDEAAHKSAIAKKVGKVQQALPR